MPSSVIRSYHYDKHSRLLFITFVSGIKYVYKKVPSTVYKSFTEAFSKGTYFNEFIKPNYNFEKLDYDNENENQHK